MLRSLSIRDFVIVDRIELDFRPGFTVLSGETGAGKSILVEALALVLGARGDAHTLRPGVERAEISAEFDLHDAPLCAQWLAENDLADEGGACVMRRVIDSAGRSRAFLNGRAVTLAQLRGAGEFLIDIHGQNQHQSLMRAGPQRELLDGYGGLLDEARRVSTACQEWRARRERRIEVESHAARFAAEREELQSQVRDIDALRFSIEEWQSLIAEHARLAHVTSLVEAVHYALEALSESDESALARFNAAANRLGNVRQYDASLSAILGPLETAGIELKEACFALRRYAERLDADPQRQREIEQRMEAVHGIARKLRITPDALPDALARARARLSELELSADPGALHRLENQALETYLSWAQRLSAGRKKAARKLADEVTRAMQNMAMAGGSFSIVLEPLDAPNAHGMEQVEFNVSPHPGLAPQPLARIASGGELSRVSLAVQTATSRVAQVPTLIFDEVDAGIGGRVAEIVGRMLKDLGRRHQVLCITHLPQVAASADHQWQVAKETANGKVSSSVTVLDAEQRVEEIARMLGGVKITDTTRRHAAEMLRLKR
jgi:DNA repair protein RecN (Recombination protein N)